MEKLLKSLDRFAERVMKLYLNTSWSRFNRTGLGIVGLILLPFFWNFLLTSKEITPPIFLLALFFTIGIIINALPITTGIYLYIRKSFLEKRLEKDESFLPSIKEKVSKDEPLTEHESQFYMAYIQSQKVKGRKLTGVEFCADLMSNENAFEHFLFRSNDEEFLFAFKQFKNSLSRAEFQEFLKMLFKKTPTRMNRLFKEGKIL